ncbi:MAG: NFACT family protein [Christensenellaceae bacterium]|nr:NFACT family protein [Christensenellaceae bacterium]
MDGLTLAASIIELKKLIGGRIEKIQQPEKYELLFSVHSNGISSRILISSSPDNCRIQLTNEKRVSPIDAPMFLMLLRKHLLGARITDVLQPNLDRIVIFRFDTLNELSDRTSYHLICEIMGKHSNIILVDDMGNIIDAIRRVSPAMSSVRLILPKLKYEFPPIQEKSDPSKSTSDDFFKVLCSAARPEKALSVAFYGLSPGIASMLLAHCGFDAANPTNAAKQLTKFYSNLLAGRFTPCILTVGSANTLLPFTPATGECRIFESMGDAADEFYRARSEGESIKRRTSALERIITNNIKRLERKMDNFSISICEDAEIERLRLYGELLTANMYSLPAPSKTAMVQNYYLDPPESVIIPLDDMLSVADNAQLYFKKYRKSKSAQEAAVVQRDAAASELKYFEGLYSDLAQCLTDSDLEEIRSELVQLGYIHNSNRKRAKLPQSKPHRYQSSDGIEISVGKNNTQNDRLTFKQSSPEDTWLHTKDIHGSHVIIHKSGEIPDTTLLEAAMLAAFYSQAKDSATVPVDYTKRRYVKKPSGAKPGMVVYTNQRTVYVTPERSRIETIKKLS